MSSSSSLDSSKKIEQAVLNVETPVEIEATVENTDKKFEWNIGRLLYQQSGESNTRAWTVRILSIGLVFPAALTLITDLGRRVAFEFGFCNGKSWSLIDQVSAGCKALANKVHATYKSFVPEKELTPQELNQQLKQAMENQAGKLVNGFRALNSGYFGSGHFDSPGARSGEKQIAKAKAELSRLTSEFLHRNVNETKDFASFLNAIQEAIRQMISQAAGDDRYVANKVVRTGPQPLLSDHIFSELLGFLRGPDYQPFLAQQFVELAKRESDVAGSLKTGVDQKVLTPDQAKFVVEGHAPVVYDLGLEKGVPEAAKASKKFLDSAVEHGLVTSDEASKIDKQVQPEVDRLAAAAAKEVARKQTPQMTNELVQKQLVQIADDLIANQKKLKQEDKSEFLTKAQEQLDAAKQEVEAQKKAEQEAGRQAELKAKQEAELAEAAKAAEVQRAAEQASLLGKFKEFLGLISQKQKELKEQFQLRDTLNEERLKLATESEDLQKQEVVLVQNGEKKKMNLLDATKIYYSEKARIAKSNAIDPEKDRLSKELVNNDENTIKLLDQLKKVDQNLDAKNGEIKTLAEKLHALHAQLTHLIAVYKVFAKNNKNQLEETNRKEVFGIEKIVNQIQNGLNTKYTDLFVRGVFARLKPLAKPVVNVDPEGNRTEVDAILQEHRKGTQVTATPLTATPSKMVPHVTRPNLLKRIWNGATDGFDAVMSYLPIGG